MQPQEPFPLVSRAFLLQNLLGQSAAHSGYHKLATTQRMPHLHRIPAAHVEYLNPTPAAHSVHLHPVRGSSTPHLAPAVHTRRVQIHSSRPSRFLNL